MAVDTPAKRFSMLDWGSGAGLMLPDGAIAAADRAHLLDLYSGIALSEIVTVTFAWPVAITLQDPPAITLQANPIITLQDPPKFTLE